LSALQQKIDFAVILRVHHANPNGDPLNYNGYGEISDVCLKRKIRDRLMELTDASGNRRFEIFVQSDDRKIDDARSLRERADKKLGGKFGSAETAKLANEAWFDVRAFGQLFALPKKSKAKGADEDGDTGISIPIRGPVTVQSAFSLEPVDVTSTQITKSVSGDGDGSKRGSDTMGMKHRVDQAIYVFYGSMNPQLAERTGFSDADAEVIKEVLPKLFENDASSARPDGSMEVLKVLWWRHNSKAGQYSSAKVHRSLHPANDGTYSLTTLEGLTPEEIDGF
jgi:CRISPR-associated protein Csd2